MTPLDPSARPIHNEELHGAVVLASSVLDLQVVVTDLRELVAMVGIERRLHARLMVVICEHLRALCADLAERVALSENSERTLRRLQREAAQLQLSLWVWRPESGLDLTAQLSRRAEYLLNEVHAGVDDTWDILREFAAECARQDISDEDLTCIITAAHARGGGKNASA